MCMLPTGGSGGQWGQKFSSLGSFNLQLSTSSDQFSGVFEAKGSAWLWEQEAVQFLCCAVTQRWWRDPQVVPPSREPSLHSGVWVVPVLVFCWPEGEELQSCFGSVCVFSCPGAASSGQLMSLDKTGMDGVEEEMLVGPEFKHSLWNSGNKWSQNPSNRHWFTWNQWYRLN